MKFSWAVTEVSMKHILKSIENVCLTGVIKYENPVKNIFHGVFIRKCVLLDIYGCFADTAVTTHENFTFHWDFQSPLMAIKFTSVRH